MRTIVGLALSAVIAVVAWFTVGQGILDKINESNARSGGGGPQNERTVSEAQLAPIVKRLRTQIGAEAQLVSVTLRPDSVEFEVVRKGRASGYRWRRGSDRLTTYEVGGSGQAGQASNGPFPGSLLDTKAPERIARTISAREHGDFHLSIGDLQRADSGKPVWILRGTIGERGVAWYAPPNGSPVRPYDPSSPDLSKGAALGQCIQGAHGDPARLSRCVSRCSRGDGSRGSDGGSQPLAGERVRTGRLQEALERHRPAVRVEDVARPELRHELRAARHDVRVAVAEPVVLAVP